MANPNNYSPPVDLPPFCDGCGSEIDPDVCGCGSDLKSHSYDEGHSFTPLGCNCCRAETDWAAVAKGLRERLRAERERGPSPRALDLLRSALADLTLDDHEKAVSLMSRALGRIITQHPNDEKEAATYASYGADRCLARGVSFIVAADDEMRGDPPEDDHTGASR